jgi:cob(I)alamin adenosyltransferase
MSNKVKIYTKTGDDGTTGLVGGSRVNKDDIRLEAYGTVDELNSVLGLLRSMLLNEQEIKLLITIQNKLFNIGSRLASDEKGEGYTASLAITGNDIQFLEDAIDKYESELSELRNFILPGGDLVSSQCHIARTICRRAERRVISFAGQLEKHQSNVKYLNRLSDLLFVLSRKLAKDNGTKEVSWEK